MARPTANACIKVSHLLTAANIGLDLVPTTGKVAIQQAEIRLSVGAVIMTNNGPPTNGTTGATFADVGSLLIDNKNGKLYINTGTLNSPTWTVVGSQT